MQEMLLIKIRRIDERPEEVDNRSRIGDWENDTVLGKEKIKRILTSVERKSGYGLASKVEMVTALIIHNKETEIFKKVPKSKRHTMTRDNGAEFGDYDIALEKKTKMKVYRATPYHSWERGSNENWNGLLRQYFPKGMYFANITQLEIDRAVRALNNRPRKRHDYLTPREIFNGVVIQSRTQAIYLYRDNFYTSCLNHKGKDHFVQLWPLLSLLFRLLLPHLQSLR